MNVYQYIDPKVEDTDAQTRWIASSQEWIANNYANRKGWEPAGGLIYTSAYLFQQLISTAHDYKKFGCDVVIAVHDWTEES